MRARTYPLAVLVLAALALGVFVFATVVAPAIAAPPPRHAYPAKRRVYWVCPMTPSGDPVTRPAGVCFRDIWP